MSERAVPFYCPYCGDEDLRPHEGDGTRGQGYPWVCGSCARVFRLSFVGLHAAAFPPSTTTPTGEEQR
ncbi:hypothetical protein JCM3263A_16600 [Thermobifida fusca]|uniref:Insertion element protein n=1 Tax=Thermobifida fusca TM51 TaxID=1169414 RepID=A0A9P2WQG5_THEFU|nr:MULTISPECIES: hypothetical protein [Thermobifida]EOR70969.1 hypothetical protein TM51_09731 [Thermobifida fusca TM51]MBO2531210.1 hypothetical protein [Thermobifida sp.]MDD6791403.1 hypothetical protein [Thermobifida fusca]PPS93635.1 hypothetical protein BH05_07275 [Thermobifida fusca]PZN64736.1 MAG: hypothetical protein DIU53_05520 [Thermobifida fusca]